MTSTRYLGWTWVPKDAQSKDPHWDRLVFRVSVVMMKSYLLGFWNIKSYKPVSPHCAVRVRSEDRSVARLWSSINCCIILHRYWSEHVLRHIVNIKQKEGMTDDWVLWNTCMVLTGFRSLTIDTNLQPDSWKVCVASDFVKGLWDI